MKDTTIVDKNLGRTGENNRMYYKYIMLKYAVTVPRLLPRRFMLGSCTGGLSLMDGVKLGRSAIYRNGNEGLPIGRAPARPQELSRFYDDLLDGIPNSFV